MSAMEAEVFDGPGLVEWMERQRIWQNGVGQAISDSYTRRINEWRRGGRARFYTVDEMLTRLGHHVSEVPDELATISMRRGRKRLTLEEQIAVLDRIEEGRTDKEIATEFGLNERSPRYYRQNRNDLQLAYEKKQELIRRLKKRESVGVLARELNLRPSAVRYYRRYLEEK